jgi:hypothetical protein
LNEKGIKKSSIKNNNSANLTKWSVSKFGSGCNIQRDLYVINEVSEPSKMISSFNLPKVTGGVSQAMFDNK